jgi:SAM-dependent methyltransferase
MAHPQQLQLVKSVSCLLASNYEKFKIIEIGSYDVNGSVRQFFNSPNYSGVDLIEGPGVDIVCEGDKVDHPDGLYDIALSCECFEHNPQWAETFQNMHRMTKDGGIVLVTCATTGRAEHGTTRTSPRESPGTQSLQWDYYQNLEERNFLLHFEMEKLFSHYFFLTNKNSNDLYFFGIKKGALPLFDIEIERLMDICLIDLEQIEKSIARRKKKEKFIPKPLRQFFLLYFKTINNKNTRMLKYF